MEGELKHAMAGSAKTTELEHKKSSSKQKSDKKNNFNDVNLRMILRDVINGYIFWSIFQGLAPMIWFYPLNELEISGYEAFAGLWLLPIVCCIPGLLNLIQNRWFLGLLRLISVASLASFQSPSTLSRLIILAIGAGVSMLVLTATLFSPSSRIRCQTYWSLILGLFAFLTSRIWFVSFVPTWWNDQTNSVVIALGTVAVLDQIISGADEIEMETEPLETSSQPFWISAALGFGSLMFLTHWCFGEVSLITRWVVKGYPDHGPLPNTWGAPVLLGLAVGVFLGEVKGLASSIVWWLLGVISIVVLYCLPTWQGYAGGLMLAVYTMTVWPVVANQVSACSPARTLALANLVYIAEVLFFVWTVAYNFVPGGVYTREHTDWLIAIVMIFILLGIKSGGKIPHDFTAFAGNIQGIKMPSGLHKAILLLMVALGLMGSGYRLDSYKQMQPVKVNPHEFTAMIWTYHFGYDNKGWPSLERTAVLINNTGADVITLLESDASKPFLGNNDLGMWLGERLGVYVDFGPATKDHTWGNLILSKYPIIQSTHHLLPSPHGELAPAITATINISGKAVDFVVTHMGNDRDVLDRKLQAEFLSEQLHKSENPAVFLGYVTSAPGSREYWQLINNGGMKDIDPTDSERWCEYIMYKRLIRLGYARISHGGLSDTEIQLGKFLIPDNPHSYQDNSQLTTDSSKVDSSVHFNPVFGKFHRGHGYFGSHHGFHMSTPKYFLP